MYTTALAVWAHCLYLSKALDVSTFRVGDYQIGLHVSSTSMEDIKGCYFSRYFPLELRDYRFPALGALIAHELMLVMDHISEERQRRTSLSAESEHAINGET